MRNSVVRFVFFTFLLLNFYAAGAQNSHSLSGYVRETDSGEAVIGAVVYSSDKRYGVSTDENGFYSLSLPDGEYSIICGCLEFLDEEIEIVLKNDIKHDFSLKRDKLQLEAATVKAQSKRDMLTIPQMGVQTIDYQETPCPHGRIRHHKGDPDDARRIYAQRRLDGLQRQRRRCGSEPCPDGRCPDI